MKLSGHDLDLGTVVARDRCRNTILTFIRSTAYAEVGIYVDLCCS